jgi:hypothetical protein
MENLMAIVYIHRIPNTKEIFYIGIGKSIKRAYEKNKYQRNIRWINIVEKYGYEIEITHNNVIWEEACVIEKYLISFWRENSKYGICNITDGGEGKLGIKLSEETKRKIGEKNRIKLTGRKITNPETIKKLSISSKKRMTDDVRKQISERMKNRVVSDETKRKLSEAKKGKSYRKGYKLSEEHKIKISNSNMGRKGANLGKKFSEEHKKKISDAQKGEKNHRYGKTNNIEHKEKISKSLKKYNKEKHALQL